VQKDAAEEEALHRLGRSTWGDILEDASVEGQRLSSSSTQNLLV
jgi:hypothetical protein